MVSRKTLAYANLLLAIFILVMYIISLVTNTKNPMFLPLISLSIIIGSFNTIKFVKPKLLGYISLCSGIILLLLSLSSFF
ncbi:hypothetical protein COJ46_19305 [Bacillus sp. AFS077874]|uniref:hypothetical protein n=1 Tax=Bacillus sp. AFS053548 TaxID=2033505 RepID=UPI000BECF776|nr:hypothetical protein [Bacillus sp. AFS053548]PEC50652.1 hypothetical protein CON00_05360 [Bacillus sp. AFS096315]PFM76854.1 hypothetical protein COJ46_19305 [Bacillus sp. AFS077874]PGM54196.1 hypothetical protein CN946_16475 [Bacillus sp. AFS053548]